MAIQTQGLREGTAAPRPQPRTSHPECPSTRLPLSTRHRDRNHPHTTRPPQIRLRTRRLPTRPPPKHRQTRTAMRHNSTAPRQVSRHRRASTKGDSTAIKAACRSTDNMGSTGKSQALRRGSHPLISNTDKLRDQGTTMARHSSSMEGTDTRSRRRMAGSREDIPNTQLRPPLNMRLSSLFLAMEATRSISGRSGRQEGQDGERRQSLAPCPHVSQRCIDHKVTREHNPLGWGMGTMPDVRFFRPGAIGLGAVGTGTDVVP